MATPHVTGVAGLIKSVKPTANDAQIKAQILQFVDKMSNLTNKTTSDGRLNAVRALTQSPDTTDPTISEPRPVPGRKTKDRTPSISATVDDNTQLTQANMQFYLDGSRRTAEYDPTTERLKYKARRLSYARHTFKIVAKDAAGNVVQEFSRFTVVR